MKIKYLGHSAFLITSENNIKIVTDPYNTGRGLSYHPINETADIVSVSHNHGDHNNTSAIKGSPIILLEKGSQIVKGIEIRAMPVYHDNLFGSRRGGDLVFCFKLDDLVVCHTGDLGHTLSPGQIDEIGPVDVLMLPVGGFFTIDAREAWIVAQSLKSHIVMPMHYKTAKTEFPIDDVQLFIKDRDNVFQPDASEIEINRISLPTVTQTIVLKPAN